MHVCGKVKAHTEQKSSVTYLENIKYFAECPLFSTMPSFTGTLAPMDGRIHADGSMEVSVFPKGISVIIR